MNIQKFWQYIPHNLVAIENAPNTLTDGFIADFDSHNIDRAELPRVNRKYPDMLKSLSYIDGADTVLSNPVLVRSPQFFEGEHGALYCYRFLTGDNEVLIQKKYCHYFWEVYPGCVFKVNNNKPILTVVVFHQGRPVGMVSPLSDNAKYYIPKSEGGQK